MANKSSSRGAILIETAIGLPVFLAVLFFCFWYGQLYFAKRSLEIAVYTGVMAGATRGDTDLLPRAVVVFNQKIDDFKESGAWPEFYFDNLGGTEAKDIYDQNLLSGGFTGAELQHFPLPALYGLFYTIESFRQSMGDGMVTVPCQDSKPRCLNCRFMTKDELECGRGSCEVTGRIAQDRYGIYCEYRLDDSFFGPAMRLLGSSQESVLLRAAYWDFITRDDFVAR